MKRWEYWIISLTIYYGKYMGFTTINIDFKNRRCKETSLFLKIFAFTGHICMIVFTPKALQANFQHVALNVRNPVIAYAQIVLNVSRFIALLVFILGRTKRDQDLLKWFEKVFTLQTSYFDRFKGIPPDTSLRKWLYFNSIIMFCHTTSLGLQMWYMMLSGKWWAFLDVIMLCTTLVIQYLVMLQHGTILCYMHECFSKLNYQLEHKIMDPKLAMMYFHLSIAIQQINRIYSPLNLCVQISLIITNSMVGYVATLYLITPNFDFNLYSYLMGGGVYVLLCWHMHIYFMLCHKVVNTVRATGTILKEFTVRMECQEIDKISLNLTLLKVDVRIYDMFDINLRAFFSMMSQTLLFTIVLVQVELQNK